MVHQEFIRSSLLWFAAGIALGIAMSMHPPWVIYRPAHAHMNVVGFLTMLVFGVGYQLLPRLFGHPLYSTRLAAAAVLQRAMELDASNAAAVTREEVINIGTELGISETAVREALRERESDPARNTVTQATPSQTSALRILALSGGAGAFAGILTSGFVSPVLGMAIVGAGLLPAMIMVSGGLALTDRTRSLVSYVRRNTAVWLGFGLGWTVLSQLFPSPMVGGIGPVRMALVRMTTVFVFTTVAGLVFLVIRRTIGGSRHDGGSSSPLGRVFRRIAHRVINAIQDILGTRTKRESARGTTTPSSAPSRNMTSILQQG
jgi:hypothetical protein